MPKHEQYEELCTLAMIGEVSSEEMQDLRQHLNECVACREQYREFTQFLLPQLSISSDTTFDTGYSAADRNRLRQEFLAIAQREGRVFSGEALRGKEGTAAVSTAPVLSQRVARPFGSYRWAIAASIAALLFVGGYGTHVVLEHRADLSASVRKPTLPALLVATNSAGNFGDGALAQLQAKNEADARTIAALEQKLSATVAALQDVQRSLQTAQAGQSSLENELHEKNSEMAALAATAQGDLKNALDLRAQVAQLQQSLSSNQATMAANELRVRDINEQLTTQTASLNREREMLSVGRDVRDLMGARNLHIIDVHDAIGTGRDKKSFGRIFYTEGKQLIFYAFDLDDKRVVSASYSYEAWGERLGQPSSVKSLGILYADDKAQRRWSLKVDDPHQLAEINSVFVTLEPHAGDGKPQGKKILFAFLGGEANHP